MTPEQFLILAEPLPEPMLLLAGSGHILAGNRAVEKRLGIALPALRGNNLADAVADTPDDIAHYLRSCSRSRSLVLGSLTLLAKGGGRVLCRTEGTLLRPRTEGAEAILLLRLIPKESAVGQFVALNQRIEELGKEIQRRRRAEEQVREEREWLRVTLASIGDGVIATDTKGRVIYLNAVAEELTGWTAKNAEGKPLETVFPILNENTRLPVENPVERVMREGVVVGLANHTMLIAKDGIERPIDDSAAPIRDSSGKMIGVVLIFRDVIEQRKAEAALRESEEKLRLLADTIPQLAWMARPDGHIFWYNSRWYEYTGTKPEQMEGWGWQSVHDPDVLPKVLERWKRSITIGEPFDMVFPLKGADGQFRPFLTRVNPLTNEGGQILYWFGTNTDIAELREAREALAVSEERLRLALDAGRMGVWDWNIRTGELKWSDSLEPLHGLAPGTFGGTFEHFQQLIHPEDRETVNIAIRQALEMGGEFYVEFRNARPNGGIHWIAGSGKVFPGDDGQPLRMIGIGLDVTQRKRAEQTSRFLADASAALAVLVDFDSTLQRVSSLAVPSFADWATVDVAEADGSLRRVSVSHIDPTKVQLALEVHHRFPPDPAAPQGVWNILRTGRSEIVPEISDELLVQSVNDAELLGITRELGLKSYIGVPLNVRGKTLGVITFINAESGHRYDNTDLAVAEDLASRAAIAIENAQLYQELRETDRRKDEFLATLAHELRNPLAPVRNALEILKMPRVDSQTVERSREMMERQVQHLVRLVDDLLDVSRVMRGKIELRKEMVELSTVVARAVETVQPLVDAQGHRLSVRMSSDSLLLDADPVRLAQVVGNLLTNAAKYMESNGRIWLTGEREGEMAVLRVRDTGIGIGEEILPRIFELFVQVDHASTKAQGGLGIGLTLVKNLVEMHNGTVQARSDGLGHGAEFVVRLPLVEQTVEQDYSSDTAGPSYRFPPPSGKRLLVVDDNQDAANSLAMLLKLQRHEVRVAYSGMAALEMIKTYTPEVVLLDIGMPGMDGYEVARRIRQTPGLGNVVLAALTGWGQQEDRRRTAEAGFDHHLVKPPEPTILESVLTDSTHREDVESTARRFLIAEDNVGAATILSLLIGKLGPHEVQMAHDGVSAVEKVTLFRPEIVLLDLGLPKLDGYAVARRLRECDEGRDVLLVALTGEGDQSKSIEAGFDEHITKPISIETLRQLLCHPKLNL